MSLNCEIEQKFEFKRNLAEVGPKSKQIARPQDSLRTIFGDWCIAAHKLNNKCAQQLKELLPQIRHEKAIVNMTQICFVSLLQVFPFILRRLCVTNCP